MGLFSFGGSTSRSSSRSRSSSFDNLDASSFDFGFDTSSSRSESGGRSTSFDRGRSSQRIAFEEVFASLFGGASGAAGRVAGQTGNITNAANMLFSAGGGIIDELRGGGVGAEYLEERIAGADNLADQQVEQLGGDLSRFLSEDVRGAITSSGVSAGTLGGSRGEVQAGIAERGAAEAFVRGSTDIRSRSRASTDQLAQALMASEADRGSTALGALPGLLGLAEGGVMAELSPFLALSQILGPQVALTESESIGGSESEQFSTALAEALGLNIGGSTTRGRAASQSASDSSSSSRSLSLGF